MDMSELLGADEGDHEVHDGGDSEDRGEDREEDHGRSPPREVGRGDEERASGPSFSTPFATRAISAKIATVAARKTASSTTTPG
jgi:hypothetical protein